LGAGCLREEGGLVPLGAGRSWSSRICGHWVPGGLGEEDLESLERAGVSGVSLGVRGPRKGNQGAWASVEEEDLRPLVPRESLGGGGPQRVGL